MNVIATSTGDRLASALGICDNGDLAGLAEQWTDHPPCLWIALAATSASDTTLKWIIEHQNDDVVLAGVACAMEARSRAWPRDPTAERGALRLRAWCTTMGYRTRSSVAFSEAGNN